MHFQPSLGWKGTKQEPKTTFPLNFFSVAIHDFSAISLLRAKIFSTVSRKKKSNLHRGVKCKTTWLHVCGKTNDAKRHCYVKSHLRPRTYINLKSFSLDALTHRVWRLFFGFSEAWTNHTDTSFLVKWGSSYFSRAEVLTMMKDERLNKFWWDKNYSDSMQSKRK